jgi:hypothetical protein
MLFSAVHRRRRAAVAAAAVAALAGALLWPPRSPALAAGVARAAAAPVGTAGTASVTVSPPPGSRVPEATGLYAVACTGVGTCLAGGNYQQRRGPVQPMLAVLAGGSWRGGTALLLPPGAARQPYARINGVACRSTGNCVAVGSYSTAKTTRAFIAMEASGRWRRAFAVAAPAGAAATSPAWLQAVACSQAGFCQAVGGYADAAGHGQIMAVAKAAGAAWGRASQIPPPPDSAPDPAASATGVACTGPGACVAVGSYRASPGRPRALGAVETGGRWHRAAAISAPPGAVPGGYTAITSVSCAPGAPCLGVGVYAVTGSRYRAMSVTESGGRFGRATAVTAAPPGAAARPSTALSAVSCPPHGRCVAVGVATNASGHTVAMYMTRVDEHWAAAFGRPVPGARAGRGQQSSLFSVACPAAGRCVAVGYFNDTAGGYRAEATAIGGR